MVTLSSVAFLLLVVLSSAAAFPARAERQTSSLFNPGVMLSGVGMQTGTVGTQGGGVNPAGNPVMASNPAQPLQSAYLGGSLQPAGTLQMASNPAGVVQTGNPGGSPVMTSGNRGYSQYGNPGGSPMLIAAASGAQQNYMVDHGSRQDYTGADFDPNSKNYGGSYNPAVGKRSVGKRFSPDVTNSQLISNPNPVNVGLSFNAGGLMFVPGSASGSLTQTGVAAAHGTGSLSSAGAFDPNTLPANQNPAGNFNPANPQTAGSFNPNAGQSFIPSNSQSAGSIQTAGSFNPNAFSAGNFDPNAIPSPLYDPSSAGVAASASFYPSDIGLSHFPPNTQSKK